MPDFSGQVLTNGTPTDSSGTQVTTNPQNGPSTTTTSSGTTIPDWAPTTNDVALGQTANKQPIAPVNQQQQALAFVNPYESQINQTIGGINTNFNAPQATSPVAGLTSLGNVAQAGVNTAGLSQAGLANAGYNTAGLNQAGLTNINTAQSNPLLMSQLQNINQLNSQAQGQGPSLAEQTAKAQAQANIQAQMAMLGSQRGASNAALGLRNAMEAKARADQQAVQAGVMGRTAEELNAQQQLTGALQGTQGQVMQGAQAQAGLNQQTALANMGAANQMGQFNAGAGNTAALANAGAANQQMLQNANMANNISLANAQSGNTANLQNAQSQNQAMLQQGAMNQQTTLANQQATLSTKLANLQALAANNQLNANQYNAMLQAQMALANNDMTAAENYMNLVTGENTQLQGIASNLNINNANNQMGLIGAGIAGAAGLGGAAISAASDRNLKTNIKSATRSMKEFLSQIGEAKAVSNFNLMEKI